VERIPPAAWIGVVHGEPELMFASITSVATDAEGRVFVGDRVGATVRMFSPWGEFLAEVAREGQGPGEIAGWPADIQVDPRGHILVRDATRLAWLDPHAPGPERVRATWSLPGYGNLASTRSRLAEGGTFLYPSLLLRGGEDPRHFYLPFEAGTGSPAGDTLRVPPLSGLRRPAFYMVNPGTGRLLDGLERVPFEPVPSWDVTAEGQVVSSDGTHAPLVVTGPGGDTIRRIALPGPGASGARIPAGVRADSLAALRARLDSVPVPLDQVEGLGPGVVEGRLPETLPGVLAVHVSAEGRLWVERWPEDPATRVFDVLALDGTPLRRLVLEAPLLRDPPPWFGNGQVVGVVRDPVTEVERVVRFDVGGGEEPEDP
jgi:hypothetical protein